MIPLRFKVILLAALAVGFLSYFRVFNHQELLTYDLRFKLRPPLKVSDKIAIIEIDDGTLKSLGAWPIPRKYHTTITDTLKKIGAKKIIFDVMFSEPSPDDELFSWVIQKARNVYLPTVFDLTVPQDTKDYKAARGKSLLSGITGGLAPYPAGIGHINVFPDLDGKIRRLPLFIRYQDTITPSISLKVAADELGLDLNKLTYKNGSIIFNNGLRVPAAANSSFLINYPGLWAKSFKHFSYFKILKSYADQKQGLKGGLDLLALKNKICFIGLTGTGTSDVGPNPLESSYLFVGALASVLNSFFTNAFIREAGVFLNTGINILAFLGAVFICLRLLPLTAFLATGIFALSYFVVSVLLFNIFGLWIDLFLPLLVMFLTFAGCLFYRFLSEAKERHALEKELDIALTIQKSFLPAEIKTLQGINISFYIQPAKFVAGDLYDVVVLSEDKIGVFIGDVAGKGASAALIMAQTISLFRIFSQKYGEPAELMLELNRELYKVLQGRFVTAQYIIIDTRNLTLTGVCAGHPAFIYYGREKNAVAELLPASGAPLGLLEGARYKVSEIKLSKGDKLFLYTDGWNEAKNKVGEQFGVERLKSAFWHNKDKQGNPVIEGLKKELAVFKNKTAQDDDITGVLLEV